MATNNKKKLGWHFLPADMKLDYSDGRTVEVGKSLSIPSHVTPQCCHAGMHASEKPSQAAHFKKGPVLCRVEVSGDIHEQADKFAGRTRKVLWAKKLTAEVIRQILDATNTSSYGYTNLDDLITRLSSAASSHPDKVDKMLINWAKKNGYSDGKVTFVKPVIDEKTVLSLFTRRMVRTAKEVKADLGKAYDLDGFDDLIDDLVVSGNILQLDDYTKSGDAGYVLAA